MNDSVVGEVFFRIQFSSSSSPYQIGIEFQFKMVDSFVLRHEIGIEMENMASQLTVHTQPLRD